MQGEPVGFASLAGGEKIDLLYVHPAATRRGVAALLVDALEKLAAGRGAKRLTADASDTSLGFYEHRGFVPMQRNTVRCNGEWFANTTVEKKLTQDEGGLMTQPETPFPRHWLYYIALKVVVIAVAVAVALKFLGYW